MMKSAQTSKIGKKFQAARESLGLSERDAASRTLINVDFITAIESGDYSIFPARMYALRYFEKYAAFLKIQQQFFDLYDVHNLPEEEEQKSSNAFIQHLKIGKYNFILAMIAGLLFIAIIGNWIYGSASSSQEDSLGEVPNAPMGFEGNQHAEILAADREVLIDAIQEINLLLMPEPKKPPEVRPSEFLVTSGDIAKLSLSFTDDSWLEVYQGVNQLIYRLFKRGENLEMSITPPFQVIVGNANGVTGIYGESEINFTQDANKLNVSVIEIYNE